ncbi:LamG-like jellyroll fold domain-containing protein [Parafilimonas terrae]|nr:LamG-like jellyroll fold domain-containing protein [Parafilimonas terrae]
MKDIYATSFLPRTCYFFKSLLLAAVLVSLTPKQAAADIWQNTNDFFYTASFDAARGSFHVYVRFYDASPIAYLHNIYLAYTTDNNTYTDLYRFTDNTVEKLSSPVSNITSYGEYLNGQNRWADIEIGIDNNIKDIKNVKLYGKEGDASGFWFYRSANGIPATAPVNGTRTVTIQQMSAFTLAPVTFITTGIIAPRALVGYKKTLNDVDKVSRMQLFYDNGTPASGLYNSVASDFVYDTIFTFNGEQGYYYKQQAYFDDISGAYPYGRVNMNSPVIQVPAFPLPYSMRGYYDTNSHAIKLSWDMDPVTAGNYVTSDFKLQVDSDPSFSNPTEKTISYNSTGNTFSYDVASNLSPHMYFRVSRDYNNTNWHLWDVGTSFDLNVPFTKFDTSKISVSLLPDNTVKIMWPVNTTAWLPGASFIITKLDYTNNTQSEIKLSETDFIKGFYIDKLIATCTEYHYTVQVVPPANSNFTAWEAVPLKDSIIRSNIGDLISISASKGYFPNRTELSWNSTGSFSNYIVERAEYGMNNYVKIGTVSASGDGSYQLDDEKGIPGTYYSYRIIGMINCNNKPVYAKDTLYAIGFRSPTGNIYGRVRYENGQSVTGVSVRLESKDAVRQGKSIYMDGTPNSYLSVDSLKTNLNDIATIEAWIKPDDANPSNQTIISRKGQYELGFDGDGKIYFNANGVIAKGDYKNINQSFIHIAGIRTQDAVMIMLNDSIIANVTAAITISAPYKGLLIGKNETGNYFKGFIDEVRIWNKAIADSVIARDYTRLITGSEDGLIAYWRFDESVTNQFFDISSNGSHYNQNDGIIYGAAIHTDAIPTPEQLSLKAYTDTSGNYFISGVPYTGNGTTYAIVPLLGTHQFDPASVNRLVSPGATEFTVDFTDKSSFPVSGYVYYRNSTVPVSGAQFKIDGVFAQQDNGTIIESDVTGAFTINVPVGYHEVKAVKTNHVFVNDGKITDRYGNNINYQDNTLNAVKLYDSTTIRFAGRVAGGSLQEALPLGHSLSTNNLGKDLSVTLALTSGNKYDLRNGNDSTLLTYHLLPSNETDSSKIHKTRVQYFQHQIVIYPDSLTGEFVADIIPEQFITSNVSATGWNNILVDPVTLKPYTVTLDLTNKFFTDSSVHSYTDSVYKNPQKPDSGYNYTNYKDVFTYNASYQFIKRVIPAVSITQVDYSNNELPYFGDSSYQAVSFLGAKESISTVDLSKNNQSKYLLGNPIFTQNAAYNFKIRAFEQYPFYTSATTVAGVDSVPTGDGFVTITNNIKKNSLPDTMSLNSDGIAYYNFTTGDPASVNEGGVKNFSANVKFGPATFVDWLWYGSKTMKGFIMGGTQTGTDFVTQGPDKILMILRDPPGSKSYSFAEKGSSINELSTYSGSYDNVGNESLTQKLGAKLVTFTGVGAGTIQSAESSTGVTVGINHEEHYSYTNTKSSTTTLTTDFKTSDDPLFVGTPADVFVGYSTNITYGASNNVTLINKKDKYADDIPITDSTKDYIVVQRSGINLSEQFGTLFAYTIDHITRNVIPGLIALRNNFLNTPLTIADSSAAQAKANADGKPVYISKLSPSDPNYGKSNNDTKAFPASAITAGFNGPSYRIFFPQQSDYRSDTIMTLNQFAAGWEARLAENEKAKLNATLLQNYSFTAGSPVSYSKTVTHDTTDTHSFSIVIGANIGASTDVDILGNGFELSIEETNSTTQGGAFETTTGTSKNIGFELSSYGVNDYLSVDVKSDGDSSFVFATKGGQTSCPYEGEETTQYYQPGTILNQPTVAIEVPVLSIDEPVASNVPETRPATYNLVLSNNSTVKSDAYFTLLYQDVDSIKGATISIDGTPIGGSGGSGRLITIPQGATITKVLTLTKGPDANDYNNIPIILKSQCDYTAADTQYISAHFIPGCSDIALAAPDNNWILNTGSDTDATGIRYIPVTINKFDVNNQYFNHVELQYKPSSASAWSTVMNFYPDSSRYDAAQEPKQIIENASAITYNLKMDDGSFNDQAYDIRAVAACVLGPGNTVVTPSDIASGIKDTYNPRLFGNPQPADGILDLGEDVRLNFNEPIEGGLLTNSKFQVTGIRNGAKSDNSVSVKLDGENDHLSTEFSKNFTGKNITVEAWILPTAAEDGTVFSQGAANNSLELAITADNHIELIVGAKKITSDAAVITPGLWSHVALVYNDSTKKVSAFYNFVQVINDVAVSAYTGTGNFEFGKSISRQGNYFKGNMHDARIWTKTLTSVELQLNSHTILSGAENSLLGYYPMDEGKGTIVYDKARGSNAVLTGNWNTPAGKAIAFAGKGYLKMNTAYAPITSSMDYTIELWFKAAPGQANAALAASGKGDGTDGGGSLNTFFLGFENSKLTFRNNGFEVHADKNYLDNNWHSVAVAVNHVSGTAQLYVDGEMQKYFDANALGGLAAPYTYLGARPFQDKDSINVTTFDRYFNGNIDEFRIWNSYLSQAIINNNNNTKLQGNELGLMTYYPFEKYYTSNTGIIETDSTLFDQSANTGVMVYGERKESLISDDMAPVKDRGPVADLSFDYVVNNDALIINLTETKQAIDKTVVTFKVKDVADKNGNYLLSPVTWTAYIDQNPLKWSDDELNLAKDIDASLQFESYIINKSGIAQNFTLDNLPKWLTADITSGVIEAAGKQKITFTVNEHTNIGAYNEVVYARNNDGQANGLSVNLTVKGKQPDWSVDPGAYKYNMGVYGKIRINDAFSINTNDLLAAFINGKCVGVTNNTYNATNDLWYAFLTVYSNEVTADNVEFRLWEAATGKTYQAIPSQTIEFKNDAITGSSSDPVIFDGKEMIFQDIELNKGWNWISYNVANANFADVNATLLNGQWSSGDIIKHNDIGFDQYSSTQGWIGTLPSFNNTSMYMLSTANAQTLSISGAAISVDSTSIPLKGERWSYISYLPGMTLSVKQALAGYNATEGDIIKSQTGFSMYDEQNGWIGSLGYLEPGKGYMFYRKNAIDTSFYYPANVDPLDGLRTGTVSNGSVNTLEMPVRSNSSYAGNMTVTAVLNDAYELLPGDMVIAHSLSGERGKAKPVINPVTNSLALFFNIAAETGEGIYFTLERNNKTIAVSNIQLSYNTDDRIGSLDKPFVIQMRANKTFISAYPNPFHSNINILVDVPASEATSLHEVYISIYSLAGKLIMNTGRQTMYNGHYQLQWDGRGANGHDCAAGVYLVNVWVDGKPYAYKVIKY